MQMLKTKRRIFFELHAKYRKVPENFSIQYNRKIINRKRVRRAIMIKGEIKSGMKYIKNNC